MHGTSRTFQKPIISSISYSLVNSYRDAFTHTGMRPEISIEPSYHKSKFQKQIKSTYWIIKSSNGLNVQEALVGALVSKTMPKALGHIASLKHVKDVTLTRNTTAAKNVGAVAREAHPGHDVSFQCPISGQPLNGQYRFCVVLPAGHIISEKAVKQVTSSRNSNCSLIATVSSMVYSHRTAKFQGGGRQSL